MEVNPQSSLVGGRLYHSAPRVNSDAVNIYIAPCQQKENSKSSFETSESCSCDLRCVQVFVCFSDVKPCQNCARKLRDAFTSSWCNQYEEVNYLVKSELNMLSMKNSSICVTL